MSSPAQEGTPEGQDARKALQQALGYLNFSSGAPDPQFLASLNLLCAEQAGTSDARPCWRVVHDRLDAALRDLQGTSAAFGDVGQARRVLSLVGELCPRYQQFHEDLLANQSESELFNSFMLGRFAEAVLSCGPDWDQRDDILTRAIRKLNDYLGYRPVAALESQKIEPYEHEWIRPIPLYVADAGVAVGRYEQLVRICLDLLRQTDADLLREAYFNLDRLDELALDPRAYDFEHPANKRPNHHFGQWDAHHIDSKGFFRRFVIQQVTVDALLSRVHERSSLPADELLWEAAAVLAGTILMSSGISGDGPGTHDSSVTLSTLLVRIAAYRDSFYDRLLARMDGTHGARLREEAKKLQQPFGGARQALNRQLTHCRATQLHRFHLARVFGRMGYTDAALGQAAHIQVPSVRLSCQLECLLTESRAAVSDGDLSRSLDCIEQARRTMLRGIQCGAIVDPWNILGFDGNFCIFGSLENSFRDHRIDELVELVEEMLEIYAHLWSAAAANEQVQIAARASACFEEFANWWHQFAAQELDSFSAEDPHVVFHAARNVARALESWHGQGEATGDIRFWAPHVSEFDSCRAYALVINTLLSRSDKVAALGLLMHWLGQADRIPMEHGETSFFHYCLQWLAMALRETGTAPSGERTGWKRIRRFFDYLEANAGDYWHVPFDALTSSASGLEAQSADDADEIGPEDDEQDELYSAAYDGVVYRDSTDDGVEGSVFDFDAHAEDSLQQSSREVADRLMFLEQLSVLWKLIAVAWSTARTEQAPDALDPDIADSISDMLRNASAHVSRTGQQLHELLQSVARYRLGRPSGDPESMAEYDRLRLLKDSLTDQIITTLVRVTEARQFLRATLIEDVDVDDAPDDEDVANRHAIELLSAVLRGDADAAAQVWPEVRQSLATQPILYVPLTRGGAPKAIARTKSRQLLVQDLLYWMPRLGLLSETYQLIELVRKMERRVPVGSGAITEFDDLFEVGCRSIVEALVDGADQEREDVESARVLVTYLEELMDPLLRSWLAHSRTLRLSVVEQVMDEDEWDDLVNFITRYGRDLFTQRFLNLGNVRGILHQGVETWIRHLQESDADDTYQSLLDALDSGLDLSRAVEKLTLILEAVVESYSEYRDYNSTTTQSDRGDLLYTLLDFLRLRTSYDRVVWNLRPIVIAHQVLATRGFSVAATQWRQSLMQRISGEAQRHVQRLNELQRQYAMRLPSVSERLSERFMRPLLIDRLRALIRPAMRDDQSNARQRAFQYVLEQAETFLDEPSGAGLDLPSWLSAMEDEVAEVRAEETVSLDGLLDEFSLPPRKLTLDQVQAQVGEWFKGKSKS